MSSAVIHRSLAKDPPLAEFGEGPYITDQNGKRYLDASGGAAVSCLGHDHPSVIAAIKAQVDKLPFAHTGFFSNEPAEKLARFLVDRAPEGFGNGRALFLGSGSEANDAALKLARQHHVERGDTQRTRFIARQQSYHGYTLGALALGHHPGRRAPYEELLIDITHIPPCYAYRHKHDDETDEAYGLRAANALEEEILRLGPETVAGFVAEPVSGATLGCATPVPGYFKRIREICDQYGVLLIADEVMCGMGRTGSLFALEQEGIAPDLVVIAKGLGAGYQPIAALLASEQVMQPIMDGSKKLWTGHTYMSHLIACAGALAVQETIENEDLLQNVRVQGAAFRELLESRFGQHPHVGDIRGRGLFMGIEFVENRETKAPFPSEKGLADRFKATAFENGLICYPSSGCVDGKLGDHVLLAPPFNVTAELLGDITDILDRTLDACLNAT